MTSRPRLRRDESGNAILEFVFVALLCFIPMVYLVVAVESVTESMAAVTQSARDAGRAFATAESSESGAQRARVAVRLTMTDHGLPDDAEVKFVALETDCASAAVAPALVAGARYRVCVTRRALIPAIPAFAQGHGVVTQGQFDLYLDDYLVPKT